MAGDPRPKAPVTAPTPRKRVRTVSPKRQRDQVRRIQVRALVERRDGWRCQGEVRGMPGACGVRGLRQDLELHEVCPRGRDSTAWLDPDRCVLLCPRHHSDVTSAHGEALRLARRLGLDVVAGPVAQPLYQRSPHA